MSHATPSSPPLVVVALGSNLGDPARLLQNALDRLRDLAGGGFAASSLWTSTPVDCPPGSPLFINAAARFVARRGDTPESLLAVLQDLERQAGRLPKSIHNEPRPLDLDLIGFGTETRSTRELVLPHPRAHSRRFVLQPVAEIAPDLRLPGWPDTAAGLLAGLDSTEILRRWDNATIESRAG